MNGNAHTALPEAFPTHTTLYDAFPMALRALCSYDLDKALYLPSPYKEPDISTYSVLRKLYALEALLRDTASH